MTILMADIASYQGGLKPEALLDAGFTAVNVKTSHGTGLKSVHPDAARWCQDTRFQLSTFHWLTDQPGIAQADHAYAQLKKLGCLDRPFAHVVDLEDPDATELELREYVACMRQWLGRDIVIYSADWYLHAKTWGDRVSLQSPWLMAAPNDGYLNAYPGDGSSHWLAGYGGYSELAVMQYTVLPISGIKVSQSAIRSPSLWAEMRGAPMSYAPQTLKDARRLWLDTFPDMNPVSMGIVGDDSHANAGSGYHLGKDALKSGAYSVTESARDSRPTNAAMALDIGWFSKNVNGATHNLRSFSKWLVSECERGAADTKDIREVIYSPDGKTVKRWDRLGKRSTGDDSHTTHTHVSYFRDSEDRDKKSLYQRYFTTVMQGDDMPLSQDDIDKVSAAVLAKLKPSFDAVPKAVLTADIVPAPTDDPANPTWGAQSYLRNTYNATVSARTYAAEARSAAQAAMQTVQALASQDGVNEAELATALAPALAPLILAGLPPEGAGISAEDIEESLRNVLRQGVNPV